MRASLGSDVGTVSTLLSPVVSTTHSQARHGQSEPNRSPGSGGSSLAPAAVQDLLHLLLHSLHQLSRLRSQQAGGSQSNATGQLSAFPDQQAAEHDSFQHELNVASFTVQTLLSEVESPAIQDAPTAPVNRNLAADGTQTLWPQQDLTATASQTPRSKQAEHATQTKGCEQSSQAAQASQTSAAVADVTGHELEQHCRRADKWKLRYRQAQQDLAAAQCAATEAAGASLGCEAAHDARSVPEASSSNLQPSSAAPTVPGQQDESQQTEDAAASHAACAEQLRAAVTVSDALAAANAELRSALGAQRSDADAETRTLRDQLVAAEANHRLAAEEAAGLQTSLEGAHRQLATLEAGLQAERDQSAMQATDLLAEKEKVSVLEVRLAAEAEKVNRARTAVLDTVDKLRKVAESPNGQAQLAAAQHRNTALELALHEAQGKLVRWRSRLRALQESHAEAVGTLQASLSAAEATASGLRTQHAEAVASLEQSQQQQATSAADAKRLKDGVEKDARRHEQTLHELQAAKDSLAAVVSAAAILAEPDGCCARPGVDNGGTLSALTQRAGDAVSKLIRRSSNLEAMLRLMEADRDRAVSEALAVNDTAGRAVEEGQTARASEAAALSACEALQAMIRELRQQHELECLALGERQVADMRKLEAAMVESRVALDRREAEDAADAVGQSQADADAAHADQLAACRAQHAAELETHRTPHAAEVERAKIELTAAASANEAVKEHFARYQAQKAEEVAALESRLRVVLQQPPQTPHVIMGSIPPCVKKLPGQVRRSVQSTASKHIKAAKPARRQPLRPVAIKAANSRQHSVRGLEPTPAEASSVPALDGTARVILAAIESDAKAAAAREAELERTQRQVSEAALAQATSAADALHERVRGLQRELATCKERAAAADASAAAARGQQSSARQRSSQLQVLV